MGDRIYQPPPEPLKLAPRPFKQHEGKTAEMYFKQVRDLTRENKELRMENAELGEAYSYMKREYKSMKEKLIKKQ